MPKEKSENFILAASPGDLYVKGKETKALENI